MFENYSMTKLIFKSVRSDLALGISFLVFFFYAILSTYLRPIADDYCVAAGATSGFLKHFQNVVSTWSGDYTQIIVSYVLVASPIAFGPAFLVGLTTLLVSVFLLLLVTVRVLHFVLPEILFEKDKRVLGSLSALLLMGWFIYWAFPASTNTYGKYKSFLSSPESFSAVFGWPTVIVQYLVVPLFLSFLAMQLQKIGPIRTVCHIFLGFLIGTSGYPIALAVFLTVLILILLKTNTFRPLRFVLLQAGILIGVYLSYSSQGSQSRVTQFLDSESNGNFVSLSRSIFVSFVEILVSIINLGTITLFLIVFLFVTLLLNKQVALKTLTFRKEFITGFSIFLSVYYLAISASEYLVYSAFWHLITFKTLLFIYIVLLAILLAIRVPHNYSVGMPARRRISVALFCVFLTALGSSTTPYISILVRGNLWAEQSMPLPGISDISPEGGWVDSCWQSLKEFRDWEDRRFDPV